MCFVTLKCINYNLYEKKKKTKENILIRKCKKIWEDLENWKLYVQSYTYTLVIKCGIFNFFFFFENNENVIFCCIELDCNFYKTIFVKQEQISSYEYNTILKLPFMDIHLQNN